MLRRSSVAVAALVLAAGLAACAQKADTTTSASTGPVSSGGASSGSAAASGSTAAGSSAGAFTGDTNPESAQPSADARVTVQNIRIIRQNGFDQVVFDIGGTGTPGWNVRYVDEAVSQGKGAPVSVSGGAILQVDITGAGYPYDTGVEEYSGANPLQAAGTQAITEVSFQHTFEGTTLSFVGTVSKTPFRVYALQSPTRVVLEVADPG